MEFLTEQEVAARLKCTRRHINKLIQEKSLSATNISSKGMRRACWRVSDEEVERFIRARQSVVPSKRPSPARVGKTPNYF